MTHDSETVIRWADGTEATWGQWLAGEMDFMSDDFAVVNQKRPTGWWDEYFMRMAGTAAEPSKDPSTKVGCVLVDDRRRVIGMGYNGFPRGVSDCAERYEHRPTKYMMVQHAEANAVLNAVVNPEGATAYVTHFPCANCAGMMIQAGIIKVVTSVPSGGIAERFKESFEISKTMFGEAGIELIFFTGESRVRINKT